MTFITPIVKLNMDGKNNIFVKREDLIPFSFGGNKVRIVKEYVKDAELKGKNCIIGYGSVNSNLCRVLANECYAKGIPCHIIYAYEDQKEICEEYFNTRIVKLCGAQIYYINKNHVAKDVKNIIQVCENKGYKPYYIFGDEFGNGNEVIPVNAYFKVYKQIMDFQKKSNIKFDYIFLATGTGMTQAGLETGRLYFNGIEQIIGISISRNAEKEKAIIEKYISLYFLKVLNTPPENSCVNVLDQYLRGGYGKGNYDLIEYIKSIYRKYGIPMDATYVGKAFYGMNQYIKDNNLCNKNILFLHTGGTPIFFDDLIRNTNDKG